MCVCALTLKALKCVGDWGRGLHSWHLPRGRSSSMPECSLSANRMGRGLWACPVFCALSLWVYVCVCVSVLMCQQREIKPHGYCSCTAATSSNGPHGS